MPSRPAGPFTAFRIADDRHPLLDGSGASRTGGRWSGKGRFVVCAALGFATATLEKLVRTRIGRIPTGQQFAEIFVPGHVAVEEVGPRDVPGWNDPGYGPSRAFGDAWYDDRRSAVLIAPCHPAMGYERNLLINQLHPEFGDPSLAAAAGLAGRAPVPPVALSLPTSRRRKRSRPGGITPAGPQVRRRSYSSRVTPKSCISIWNRLMKLR